MDFTVVTDALTSILVGIVNFIPKLINGIIILVVGVLIARLARWILRTVLVRIRFDPLVERSGVTGALRGLGVQMPVSSILAQTVFGLLLLSFMITATRLMELTAVATLLEGVLRFLPQLIAACIVFLLGGIAAQFAGGLVTTVARASGLNGAPVIGRIVQYLLSVFVGILALGVLGLDTAILVTALTIALAAFGLALGLALGLGGRTIVYQIMAGYYLRQRLPIGGPIVLGEIRGEVSAIGGVNAVITTPTGRVIVPNRRLLESIVEAPTAPAAPIAPTEPTPQI